MNTFKSYKRLHPYNHESDVEKGKISKETSKVVNSRKRQAKKLKTLLKHYDPKVDDSFTDYEHEVHREKKEHGNLKVHKTRLKSLIKDDIID